ncbi:MAG TPA: YdeI/OmpD-associated family protein [Opitutaceae bacterium]|nr:YdeI/OmpD-associated family protein [Opitutaceae bacterium]
MPTFTARIEKNWMMRCVIAPAAVVRALGGGVRIPVVARYAGETVVTTLMPAGRGRGRLTVLTEILRAAGLDIGDRLTVELTRSTDAREPVVPPDLQRALRFRPGAAEAYRAAPPFLRRWMVRYLEEARRMETRQARIELILERLAERKRRSSAVE